MLTETVVSVPYQPMSRRDELLEKAYAYVLEHGLAGMSLRPLAAAIGSSPRVLLFLFGSKDELVRALLARARADELEHADGPLEVWEWLAAPAHRGLLTLWVEAYARSLADPSGPWVGFARGTVEDWLALLGGDTGALAVLRGAMLDLLATGDEPRITAAVRERLGVPAGS
jgi:AcrR family transcriptional regulator